MADRSQPQPQQHTPTPRQPTTRECSLCGEENPTEATVCRFCGERVDFLNHVQEADLTDAPRQH